MLKVMVVEDSVLLADMLEDFLVSQGYEVCGLARTVKEAVVLADLTKPDLAVLDFRLANGELATGIPPMLKDKTGIGVLYVSGDPLSSYLTEADGDAYIQKPCGMHDLVCALRIVQSLKTDHNVSPSSFPKGFHLLKHPFKDNRKAL
jgi:DNA-binding response OmpR family regulator